MTNKRLDPVMVVLDRALVSPPWEMKYPLATAVSHKTRFGPHNPLLITTKPEGGVRSKVFRMEPTGSHRKALRTG